MLAINYIYTSKFCIILYIHLILFFNIKKVLHRKETAHRMKKDKANAMVVFFSESGRPTPFIFEIGQMGFT